MEAKRVVEIPRVEVAVVTSKEVLSDFDIEAEDSVEVRVQLLTGTEISIVGIKKGDHFSFGGMLQNVEKVVPRLPPDLNRHVRFGRPGTSIE